MGGGQIALVFVGARGAVNRAVRLLDGAGIAYRATRPRRAEGCIFTAPLDAPRARETIAGQTPPGGRVVQESEAAQLLCPTCGTLLSFGSESCALGDTVVGDPHGR